MLIIVGLACLSAGLVVYHHVGWPLLLRWLAAKRHKGTPPSSAIAAQPSITLIIPIYNEAALVADKLWNLSILDYPEEKLHIQLLCDGCSDDSAAIIKDTLTDNALSTLPVKLIEHQENRGKLAVIDEAIQAATSDIIVMSDCSALMALDSLQRIADCFTQDDIGVVCATYHMMAHGSAGEEAYWRYQRAIKKAESVIGSVIGAHGACYAFRRALYTPLEAGTINDDFIIPMQIVAQGYRAIYDESIMSVELEQASESVDFKRRVRIGAGNMQQILICKTLLHPQHGMTALSFFSGKVLRVAMPYLMLSAFALSYIASWMHPLFFIFLLLPQLAIYGLACLALIQKRTRGKLAALRYLIIGHTATLVGSWQMLTNPKNIDW